LTLNPSLHAYLVLARGSVTVNGTALGARDGAAITGETTLTFTGVEEAEVVLVDAA
jgi:hypothetical protein